MEVCETYQDRELEPTKESEAISFEIMIGAALWTNSKEFREAVTSSTPVGQIQAFIARNVFRERCMHVYQNGAAAVRDKSTDKCLVLRSSVV